MIFPGKIIGAAYPLTAALEVPRTVYPRPTGRNPEAAKSRVPAGRLSPGGCISRPGALSEV